jgi:hypothetical protein
MPKRSVRQSTSRVYRHTVKRQLEASLTLPQIQKHGFTHPRDGYFLMLPRELDVVLALETKAVALTVLAVLRCTIGALAMVHRGVKSGSSSRHTPWLMQH